jgi:hypothetical protein
MDKEDNSTRYDMEFICKSPIDKNDQQERNANNRGKKTWKYRAQGKGKKSREK